MQAAIDWSTAPRENADPTIGRKGTRNARIYCKWIDAAIERRIMTANKPGPYTLRVILEPECRIKSRPSTDRRIAAVRSPRSCRQHPIPEIESRIAFNKGQTGRHTKRIVGLEVYTGLEHGQTFDGQMPSAISRKWGIRENDVEWPIGEARRRLGATEKFQRRSEKISIR